MFPVRVWLWVALLGLTWTAAATGQDAVGNALAALRDVTPEGYGLQRACNQLEQLRDDGAAGIPLLRQHVEHFHRRAERTDYVASRLKLLLAERQQLAFSSSQLQARNRLISLDAEIRALEQERARPGQPTAKALRAFLFRAAGCIGLVGGGAVEEARDYLVRLAKHRDPALRFAGLFGLTAFCRNNMDQAPIVEPLLRNALQDSDQDIRRAANACLTYLREEDKKLSVRWRGVSAGLEVKKVKKRK